MVEQELHRLSRAKKGVPGVGDGVVAGGEGGEVSGGDVHVAVTSSRPVTVVVVCGEPVVGDGGAGGGPILPIGTRSIEAITAARFTAYLLLFLLLKFPCTKIHICERSELPLGLGGDCCRASVAGEMLNNDL